MRKINGFEVYELLENVYHIVDPTDVAATLIVGEDKALLVDTCSGVCDLKSTVEELCDREVMVVNTHSHLDHSGGDYQFDKVYMNSVELDNAMKYLDLLDIRQIVLKRYQDNGGEISEETVKRYLGYCFENAEILDENQVIDLGGIHVEAVAMHSHTPGMTGFLVREKELLLGGDSVCRMTTLYFDEASSLEDHLKMLKEVSSLNFKHILASHTKDLLGRDDLEAMIECCENYDEAKTTRLADQYYPQYGGRMFIYRSQKDKYAIVVAKRKA